MRRFSTVIALASLVAALAPLGARASCWPVPEEVCEELPVGPAGPDPNVLAVASTYGPDSVDVEFGGKVYFQNFDLVAHTITHSGCVDGSGATPCLFVKALPKGARGQRAIALPIAAGMASGQAYRYVCTIHDGMGGRFRVR